MRKTILVTGGAGFIGGCFVRQVVGERKARVVELRFFGGLSVEETAEVVGVSAETVMRDWKFARSWLHAQLSGS